MTFSSVVEHKESIEIEKNQETFCICVFFDEYSIKISVNTYDISRYIISVSKCQEKNPDSNLEFSQKRASDGYLRKICFLAWHQILIEANNLQPKLDIY